VNAERKQELQKIPRLQREDSKEKETHHQAPRERRVKLDQKIYHFTPEREHRLMVRERIRLFLPMGGGKRVFWAKERSAAPALQEKE